MGIKEGTKIIMLTRITDNKLLTKILFVFLFVTAIVVAAYMVKRDILNIEFPSTLYYYSLIPIFIFQLLFWAFSTLAWVSGINIFAKIKIPFMVGFIHCNTVSIGKYLPGKIWGLLGRGFELKKWGVTNKEVIFLSYIDQILLLHSGFIISATFLSINYYSKYFYVVFILSVLSIVLIPLLNNFLLKFKYFNRLISSTIDLKKYIYLFFLYCLLWVFAGLVFSFIYYFLYGFKYDLTFVLIGACAVGILSGFIAFFAPGGIGVREATSTAVLSIFMPTEKALLFVLVYRAWTTLTDILGGMISLYLMRFISR